jgi:hypothetical protein
MNIANITKNYNNRKHERPKYLHSIFFPSLNEQLRRRLAVEFDTAEAALRTLEAEGARGRQN